MYPFQWIKNSFKRLLQLFKKPPPLPPPSQSIALRVEAHLEVLRLMNSKLDLVDFTLGSIQKEASFVAQKIRTPENENLYQKIKSSNPNYIDELFLIIKKITEAKSPPDLILLMKDIDIDYFKISILSEMAMLLRPRDYLVVNVKTLMFYCKKNPDIRWNHLVNNEEKLRSFLYEYYHLWKKLFYEVQKLNQHFPEIPLNSPYYFFEIEQKIYEYLIKL